MRKIFKSKKGQGIVEYGILVGGIALVALAAVSILGHKTTDIVATVAAALPGAHADDVGAIVSGQIVQTTELAAGGIVLDATNPGSLASNLGIDGEGLVIHLGEDDDQ